MATTSAAGGDDRRFTLPLYTLAEGARFLGVPATTLSTWARGYVRRRPEGGRVAGEPVISSTKSAPGEPSLPFVGLAEAFVVAAFRRAGVSLQHIRRAVAELRREIGLEHALASERLYTDGARVLFDYAEREEDEQLAQLTVVVSQQRVFGEVVADYLRRISYGDDGWPARLVSPATPREVVAVDPRRGFGQPIFLRGGARVEDVLDRFRAGEGLQGVAEDFGVPVEDVEDVLRVSLPAAA